MGAFVRERKSRCMAFWRYIKIYRNMRLKFPQKTYTHTSFQIIYPRIYFVSPKYASHSLIWLGIDVMPEIHKLCTEGGCASVLVSTHHQLSAHIHTAAFYRRLLFLKALSISIIIVRYHRTVAYIPLAFAREQC